MFLWRSLKPSAVAAAAEAAARGRPSLAKDKAEGTTQPGTEPPAPASTTKPSPA